MELYMCACLLGISVYILYTFIYIAIYIYIYIAAGPFVSSTRLLNHPAQKKIDTSFNQKLLNLSSRFA